MRRLVLLAGKQIMHIYNSDDLRIRKKKDRSAVTMADEAADAIISKGLLKKFPDINVVTEGGRGKRVSNEKPTEN